MSENQADAVLREKLLYRYTSAVERGDFTAAAAILAQAEGDPQLEQMIVEVNAALVDELPPAPRLPVRPRAGRWQRVRAMLRTFAPGMGLSALVLVLVIGLLALIGPAVGNTFTNAINLPRTDDSHARQGYVAQPTPMAYSESNRFRAYPAGATATPYYARPSRTPNSNFAGPATPTTGPASAAAAADAIPTAQPRMVARNAYLSLTVADTRKARDTISEVISTYAGEGAIILSSKEQVMDGSDQPAILMQLRVPVARYDVVMSRLVGLALTVDARQEQADDVTAEYVDTQARIRELQTAIDRLLEIARSAQSTEDLLTVEKALSDRRAELEAMEGRAQYLSQTAALSLIQLDLHPKIVSPTRTPTPLPTPEAWRPQETAQRSALILLRDLRRFGDWLIVFGITRLPWLVAVGLVGFAGYMLVRRSRRH